MVPLYNCVIWIKVGEASCVRCRAHERRMRENEIDDRLSADSAFQGIDNRGHRDATWCNIKSAAPRYNNKRHVQLPMRLNTSFTGVIPGHR